MRYKILTHVVTFAEHSELGTQSGHAADSAVGKDTRLWPEVVSANCAKRTPRGPEATVSVHPPRVPAFTCRTMDTCLPRHVQ